MLCDNCKERDAIINLTQVEHDSKVTLHLCEQCAQQKGVETGGAVLKTPLGNFLGAVVKGGGAAGALVPTSGDALRCPACGSTLRDFRDSGRLGCDQCYVSFDTHLRDLLRRLHGSSQHVGERYDLPGAGGNGERGGDGGDDPRSRLLELKAQLRRAVEGENFELAAELRDRIRVLE
jgi:protein arginine kinase activator